MDGGTEAVVAPERVEGNGLQAMGGGGFVTPLQRASCCVKYIITVSIVGHHSLQPEEL